MINIFFNVLVDCGYIHKNKKKRQIVAPFCKFYIFFIQATKVLIKQ